MSEERAPYDLVSEAADWAAITADRLAARQVVKARESNQSVRDLLARALPQLVSAENEPLPGEPPPEVPTAPAWPDPRTVWDGFTAPTHWEGDSRAVDVYLHVPLGEWLGFPVAGEVRRMSSTGPLGTALVTALLYCTEGPWAQWLFAFTHVLDSIRTGYRPAAEPFFQYGNSGIETLPEAQHIHFCADAPGGIRMTPDGKGDVGALACLDALGFQLGRVAAVPSPQDYLSGRARGGQFV